jgi:hypothetical protein
MREDLKVWLSFLSDYNGITVMLDNVWTSNETICLFTDSAGGRDKGFGIYFQGKWAQGCWLICKPLEMFSVFRDNGPKIGKNIIFLA